MASLAPSAEASDGAQVMADTWLDAAPPARARAKRGFRAALAVLLAGAVAGSASLVMTGLEAPGTGMTRAEPAVTAGASEATRGAPDRAAVRVALTEPVVAPMPPGAPANATAMAGHESTERAPARASARPTRAVASPAPPKARPRPRASTPLRLYERD